MDEVIFSPAYFGKHNYAQYELMKQNLQEILNKENVIIDTDFIQPEEVRSYFFEIFGIEFIKHHKRVLLQSDSRRRLRRIRKMLKQLVIQTGVVFMEKGRYRMRVEN